MLIGDHAGSAIPASLDQLGLPPEERRRHIAIDIGIEALGTRLSQRLDAPFIWQTYSRLVVDCNRRPDEAGWIAAISDHTAVPGNRDLDESDRQARHDAIYAPYHQAIGHALDRRADRQPPITLVSLHSFTPFMNGARRPWDIAVLHDGHNDAFARKVLQFLQADGSWVVGDNEPYRMDAVDHTIPHHAFARGLPYIELEMRQDLLADPQTFLRIADTLERVLLEALPSS